jgi:hypothetical protein
VIFQVRNDGTGTELFGIYLDIIPPGGITNPYGCTPSGRILDTVITLAPGAQQTFSIDLVFNCADVQGALNQNWTIMGAVDVHADDGGACGVFQIQSMTCFNALADDDDDDSDNRVATAGPRVK